MEVRGRSALKSEGWEIAGDKEVCVCVCGGRGTRVYNEMPCWSSDLVFFNNQSQCIMST